MRSTRRYRRWGGAIFVLLTLLGSWGALLTLFAAGWLAPPQMITEVFSMSFLYALIMGLPPLFAAWAVHHWVEPLSSFELGVRDTKLPVSVMSAALALALVLFSASGSALLGALGVLSPAVTPAFDNAAQVPNLGQTLLLVLAFFGTISLLWLQSLTEELGWRGYLLLRLLRRLGRWGLLVHGLIWGLWYAPLLLLAGGWGSLRVGGFFVGLVLLGSLLAWLRLWTNSIVSVVIANVMITLATGWPYLLYGREVGLRGALFEPIGWLLMGLILLVLLLRHRDLLSVSSQATGDRRASIHFDSSGDRLLH